ncbi:MAG: hypothetical protein ACREAA_05920 [Candidatus Polarisedimenticolia bacterium]
MAGAHTWRIGEVFSNADGTIQFVELFESAGTPGETGLGGWILTSNTNTQSLTNVAAPTSNRRFLVATASFAALPGAPTPDIIIPVASIPFFATGGDTISIQIDTWVIGPVPTDGVNSLNRTGGSLPNSPTNYAGVTGSVNANPPAPPAVPESMTVQALDVDGTALQISFDTATCSSSASHYLLYGDGSNLPSAPGGAFSLAGSVCSISGSPFVWDPSPAPGTGSFIWWVIVRSVGSVEGSWGLDSAGAERVGPGAGGVSGQCLATSKSLTNTCGQ